MGKKYATVPVAKILPTILVLAYEQKVPVVVASVVARARDVLDMLEEGSRSGGGKIQIDDLPLFAAAPAPQPRPAAGPSPVEELLSEIHPDDLSPREALEALYRLKEAID